MLRRNLLANYIGQGWVALMSLAFIPIYIRFLGIESFGLIGLFAVLTAWLNLLDMAINPTLSREMARFLAGSHSPISIRDLLRSAEAIALGGAGLIAGGVAFASRWLAESWLRVEDLTVDSVTQAFLIMGLVTALRFVEGVYRSSIIGLQRQVLFNVVISSMATLRGVGAVVVLAWIAPTIQAFFLWQAFVSLATVGLLSVFTYRLLPKASRPARFSLDSLRSVWRFAGGMVGIAFLALLLTQVDKILLSRMLTLGEFGYYTLAATVATALFMLITPITQAWYPKLCELSARSAEIELATTFHQGTQLVAVIAGSAAIVLAFFSDWFLHLWTQDAALSKRVAPLLSLLVTGNLLNGLMWLPYQAQLAHGWTGLALRINVIAVLIIVPALLWATPLFGAIGAAWVWIGLNLGYLLVGAHFMFRRILRQEKYRWYVHDMFAPLTAGIIVASCAKWFLSLPESNIQRLSVLLIASIMTISCSALASNHIRALVSKALARFSLAYRRER